MRGYTLIGLQSGTLIGGLYFQYFCAAKRDDYAEKYNSLGAGRSQETYDLYYDGFKKYERRQKLGKYFLLSAGALYAFNLLDVMLYDQERAYVSVTSSGKVQVALRF